MSDTTKALLMDLFPKVTRLLEKTLQHKKTVFFSIVGLILWYQNKKSSYKQQKKSLGRIKHAKPGAIDIVFLNRLCHVLRTGMPSIWCRETAFALLLSLVLLIRSFMTLYINVMVGNFVRHLTSRNAKGCSNVILQFLMVGVPLSFLNASLKYFTVSLSMFIREKITYRCHELYIKNMNYYVANRIGTKKLDAADQLIAEDIQKFSFTLCDVFSNMLKPVVDFVIFSIQLARWLQIRGPLSMYGWFTFASWVCSLVVPPFGKIVVESQELEGNFRKLHTRLINNSEMIAFNGGEKPEKRLIDESISTIQNHSRISRWLQLSYHFVSGYLNKYSATTVGLVVTVLPILFNERNYSSFVPSDIASYYVETTGIMAGQAEAVLRLFDLQKTIGKLGGLTLRVWTLIHTLENTEKFNIPQEPDNPPQIQLSPSLSFKKVSIIAPTGKILIKHLNFSVPPGTRIMVTGENGVGKSSLFRVLRGLWPLYVGTILTPPVTDQSSFYFLSQANFVPIGSLREIIIYPHLPSDMAAANKSDKDLWHVLKLSDLDGLIINGTKPTMDTILDWEINLSPGQKQRMAFARLFYHHPKYAVLDDCTNGVFPNVEVDLYNRCRSLDITVLTIAHKSELKRLHDFELKLLKDDNESGRWELVKLEPE